MISEWTFGTLPDGQDVRAYTLKAESGLRATVLNYGAILQDVQLPDGRAVALGFETLDGYARDTAYIGRIIGRNANRIVGATFEIDGQRYDLPANDRANNLHSGPEGFDTQIWAAEVKGETLILSHTSPDGHQGFPGRVETTLRIWLTDDTLHLDLEATTDAPTPVNPTWHPYWNLAGKGRIDGHDLQIAADQYSVLTETEPMPVDQTRFDFRRTLPLGSVRLDDNYVGAAKAVLRWRDTTLTVTSTLPDLQAYTGDQLPKPRTGIALEPQFRPNDINLDQQSLLRPSEIYHHRISYQFSDPSLTKP